MADVGETKYCSNCKRDIALSNFVMHEMHCRRHITLCEHCQEPIPRSELEEHFNESHAKIPCERCKMEIAKDSMEDHLENDCMKKPMRCEYCELEYPKIEYPSHLDHCGSRTEPCTLCQQYVMLKHMIQHENSGCTFPEPKPAPAQSTSNNTDPFRMDDFHYMFGANNFGSEDTFPDFTSNLRSELLRNGRAQQSRPPARTAAAAKVNKSNTSVNSRKTYNTGNKKSDVNVQRARNLLPAESSNNDWKSSLPPDMDYDTMLALQLAHEDWQDDTEDPDSSHQIDNRLSVADLVNDRVNNIPDSRSTLQTRHQGTQNVRPVVSDDDMSIPCELCEMEIPLSSYLEHVESCQAGDLSHDNRNNDTVTTQHTRASIPVINNLRSDDLNFSVSDDTPLTREELDNEEFILPCEFCEDVFPAELIIQHQSVCPANGMVTPRSTTPATTRQQNRNVITPSNLSIPNSDSQTRQKRHVDPVLLDFLTDDTDDIVGDSDQSPQHRGSSNGQNQFTFHKISSSNKYSPAMDRFVDAMARPPRRRSGQSNHEEERDVNGVVAETRQSKSAQRARARLNQLLQEDVGHESSASASGVKPKKTSRPLAQLDKNHPVVRDRKTQVSSRTVMNQLEKPRQNPGRNRSEDSPGNQAAGRTRQRSDQIFSPELRLKPDHNRQPKKR